MTDTLVRVEKGSAGAEELAAVTAVLLARATATPTAETGLRHTPANWPQDTPGFTAPHSWQG